MSDISALSLQCYYRRKARSSPTSQTGNTLPKCNSVRGTCMARATEAKFDSENRMSDILISVQRHRVLIIQNTLDRHFT
jgi:hypothetical protein